MTHIQNALTLSLSLFSTTLLLDKQYKIHGKQKKIFMKNKEYTSIHGFLSAPRICGLTFVQISEETQLIGEN